MEYINAGSQSDNGWCRSLTWEVKDKGKTLGFFTEYYARDLHVTFANLPGGQSHFVGQDVGHTTAGIFLARLARRS